MKAFFVFLLALVTPGLSSAQQTLRVAAAADLQPVLPPILKQFEAQTGIHAEASYQSSATLATQILNGAPFDLFLAADLSFPQRVIDAGKAEESQPVRYARGTLVLWARNDSHFARLSIDTLKEASLKSIAIANPEHAPYGRAAKAALEKLGLWDTLRPKLVIAENIAQAAQYVDSGNAEIGFVSLTSALTQRLQADGHYVTVPAEDYPPIIQGAVVVKGAAEAQAARQLLLFMRSSSVRDQLVPHGLAPTN